MCLNFIALIMLLLFLSLALLVLLLLGRMITDRSLICQNWFHSAFAGLLSSIMISLSAESLRPYSIRSQLASAGYSGERPCELQPFQSLAAFSHRSLEKRRYDMMR